MTINNFMKHNFPGLELKSPLFYSWDAGIRFELGVNESSVSIHENPLYLQGVYRRAIELFEALHTPEDELYLVVDVHDYGKAAALQRKLNIFAKYVKENSVLIRLRHENRPYIYPEDDEDGTCRTHRFSLTCRRADFRYAALLKAICNQDMGIRPVIHQSVYFINETKGTIYYVYDDRGCDLLGVNSEAIQWMYEEFNEWILDYVRPKIDEVFI
ncbi:MULTISPECIES: DUF3885 domain-containing protein [unclassified Sporosarcina]|uniref:DUF3885 domain-containing protein n=1 Tax=unclassified Sporosarcina TaxID=2647733 RepID=UPI00203F2641|nr:MULTISPECIES: DUF3885 domain-containing protein [unclassified Sporosarcina]GKV65122.1 hypothetical protein NCCP2331_12750 [Sporosarcina sp. NCCP-2331]GLB55246.1 hypothetical protein NCCP2378_10320 [Sporosarcina sp. NCCP-2378]